MLGMFAVVFVMLLTALPIAAAQAETRSLKLYFLHTGERAEITFKKNGKYIDGGLKKINRFLRDWRRNEPTKMDPRLLDLVWEVYQETGSKKPIHVISAYRSPATNSLLKKRGRGVATKSQHTLGKALDFFIPGVSLAKLRNIGLKKGIGGVGYYPKSGSPFVHMDTGNVRHWPRMSRGELVRVFPDGKTLHVPTDGKPLARYNQAKAEYDRKQRGAGKIEIAKAEDIEKKPGFFAKLLGRGDDDDEDTSGVSAGAPVPVQTTTTPAPAPVPAAPVAEPSAPTAETILASLPAGSVPVPALAPRIAAAPAALETPAPDAPSDAPIETQAPLDEENLAEDTTIAIASVVPQRRPSYTAEPVLAENPADPDSAATVEIAALTPQQAPQQTPDTSIDAGGNTGVFSANEIEDLRKQVYATIRAERQNIAPNLAPPAPVGEPGIALASAAPAPVQSQTPGSQSRLGLVENEVRGTTASQQVINALLDEPRPIEPGTEASGNVPVPVANELKTNPLPVVTASLEPLEAGGVVTTGEAIPLPNPNRANEPESPVAGTGSLVTAGVAVPSPAERPELRLPVQTAAVAPNTQAKPQLERLETADLDEKLVGKWALAADTSISRIAEINPPAYGLNALRELPDTVLSSGFSRENIKDIEQGFTGSSIEFLDFTRFN